MIELVESKIVSYLDEIGYEKAKVMMLEIPSGKMLRSRVVEAVAGVNTDSVELSSIIEMIHLASLLHDDVIDKADKRRGMESINAKYGDINAVMLGDILYSKAFYELTSKPEFISKSVAKAVNQLSIGEMMDVDYSALFNSSRDLYYEIIYLKTGVLIEAATKCAAFLAGKDVDRLGLFGKNIGMAFQIVDDILDVTSDSDTLGKPAFSDFREGKSTLPFILLYEKLDSDKKNKLEELCGKNFDKKTENWIKEEFANHGILELARGEALKLLHIAKESAVGEAKLLELADKLVDRKF